MKCPVCESREIFQQKIGSLVLQCKICRNRFELLNNNLVKLEPEEDR